MIAALAPSSAFASTWTVDDDKADCPNAAFTSIQAAVDQAAPWDTVVICAGPVPRAVDADVGQQQPEPGRVAQRPDDHQAAHDQGRGREQGHDPPGAALGATLAGTAPYLRDGGGNVVTVVAPVASASSDDNENFVDISGVTIESPRHRRGGRARVLQHVRAGSPTAASARSSPSRPVRLRRGHDQLAAGRRGRHPARGHAREEPGQRPAVLFDDARGADGTATTTVRSGIKAYGNLVGSRVVGPVTYTYGQRGSITGSEITGALTLTDAETGPDPRNPARARLLGRAPRAARRPDQHGRGHRAGRRQLVGLRDRERHDRPGRASARALTEAPAPLSVPAADARRARRPARSSTRSARPSCLGRDDLPGRRRRRRLRRQVGRADRERPAGRDRRPHAVRVRVHARVRAHRRSRRHAHGDDHRLLRPVEHGLDRARRARRSRPTTPGDGQRLGPGDAGAERSARPRRSAPSRPASRRTTSRPPARTSLSTAGDALLSVVDPSATAPGHLVNGTFVAPAAAAGPRAERRQHRHHVRHRQRQRR